MATATMTSKGQVTIPREIREGLKLKPQDKISFTLLPDGSVVMRAKAHHFSDLYGSLYDPKRKPITVDQMKR